MNTMTTKSLGFNKKLLSFYLFIFFQCFGIVFLSGGIGLFFIGFHNMDQGQNLKYINCDSGREYVDYVNKDTYWTPNQTYMQGVNSLIIGFILSLLGAFLVGYTGLIYEIGCNKIFNDDTDANKRHIKKYKRKTRKTRMCSAKL